MCTRTLPVKSPQTTSMHFFFHLCNFHHCRQILKTSNVSAISVIMATHFIICFFVSYIIPSVFVVLKPWVRNFDFNSHENKRKTHSVHGVSPNFCMLVCVSRKIQMSRFSHPVSWLEGSPVLWFADKNKQTISSKKLKIDNVTDEVHVRINCSVKISYE